MHYIADIQPLLLILVYKLLLLCSDYGVQSLNRDNLRYPFYDSLISVFGIKPQSGLVQGHLLQGLVENVALLEVIDEIPHIHILLTIIQVRRET